MASADKPPAIRLLVVDDDETLLEMMTQRFDRKGIKIVTAGNGADALDPRRRKAVSTSPFSMWACPTSMASNSWPSSRNSSRRWKSIMLTAHGSIETAIQAMKARRLRLSDQAVPLPRAGNPHPEGVREGVAGPARTAVGRAHRLRIAALPPGRLQPAACSAWCSSSKKSRRPTPPC